MLFRLCKEQMACRSQRAARLGALHVIKRGKSVPTDGMSCPTWWLRDLGASPLWQLSGKQFG
jgi:hypothetical protein